MIEKRTFQMSGLIKDKTNLEEIEFWGHDAGEFTPEEIVEILEAAENLHETQEMPEVAEK